MLPIDVDSPLSAEELRLVLRYNPNTGDFTRLQSPRSDLIGKRAGAISSSTGYVVIAVNRRYYFGHRLAWLYMKGEWPTERLDHKDLNRANNRWDNLRPASDSQNKQNNRVSPLSTTGLKGVTPFQGRFQARIKIPGAKRIFLGSFATAEAAYEAYCAAAEKHFKEFARY